MKTYPTYLNKNWSLIYSKRETQEKLLNTALDSTSSIITSGVTLEGIKEYDFRIAFFTRLLASMFSNKLILSKVYKKIIKKGSKVQSTRISTNLSTSETSKISVLNLKQYLTLIILPFYFHYINPEPPVEYVGKVVNLIFQFPRKMWEVPNLRSPNKVKKLMKTDRLYINIHFENEANAEVFYNNIITQYNALLANQK